MRQALQILELARGLNLHLQPVWVSCADPWLQKADALSKHINSYDWSVHWDAFESLRQMVGEFMVDLFASAQNFKVERYYSYSYTRTCAGIDAFTHTWDGEVAYCAPLIALIWQVIRKIEAFSMLGILITPLWRGAKFWLSAFP
jgi:hypothetical protein